MEDARRDAAHTAVSQSARDGLAALTAQRIQRHTPLSVRTQESVRQLVDQVAAESGARIVEVVEYAILHTYSKQDEPLP